MSKHTTDYLIVSENYSYVLPLCKILHYQMSRIYWSVMKYIGFICENMKTDGTVACV